MNFTEKKIAKGLAGIMLNSLDSAYKQAAFLGFKEETMLLFSLLAHALKKELAGADQENVS